MSRATSASSVTGASVIEESFRFHVGSLCRDALGGGLACRRQGHQEFSKRETQQRRRAASATPACRCGRPRGRSHAPAWPHLSVSRVQLAGQQPTAHQAGERGQATNSGDCRRMTVCSSRSSAPAVDRARRPDARRAPSRPGAFGPRPAWSNTSMCSQQALAALSALGAWVAGTRGLLAHPSFVAQVLE